jgi:hypothetical protein
LCRTLQFTVIAARRDWAEKNKVAATGFARAFGNAYKFMPDPTNRAEVAQILVETTGAPIDVARSMLAFYYEPDRGVMPKQAEISMPGMSKVIELLGETRRAERAAAACGTVRGFAVSEGSGAAIILRRRPREGGDP